MFEHFFCSAWWGHSHVIDSALTSIMDLTSVVHRDAARTSSPRSPAGPAINDGPCAEVGSVSLATATQRSVDVPELTTTNANQVVNSSDHQSALALVAPGGSHVVARCIDLLQTDPEIQVLFPPG